MMGRMVAILVSALLVAALVGACGEIPQRRYFTLSYPSESSDGDRPALHPVVLRVDRFDTALPFDRTQIVYRESPYQFSYYNYRLWAAKPQRMMRSVAMRHFQTSRLVERVVQDYGQELPDYELSAEVEALEEYDSGDVWYGHLAMRFELTRFADQETIWTYRFDRKKRVAEKKLIFVVRALSRIAEEEMQRVVAQIDHVLARERGVEPTLTVPPPSRDEVVEPEREPDERPKRFRAPPTEPEPDDEEDRLITPDDPGEASQDGKGELITPDESPPSGGSGDT